MWKNKRSEFWRGKPTESTVAPVIQTMKQKSQRMEIRKIKQVRKKKFLRRDVTLSSRMKTCDFSRRSDEGALDWPPSVPEYFTVVIAREKIIRRGGGGITFFPSSTLQIMVGGRKTYLAFFHTSPSLCKLTAHHKSISAWRKSISRLPSFHSKKKERKLPELLWGGEE